MALTQISTGGIKDDAVTDAKLPANSVGNSEMKDDAVGVAELSATGTASSSTFLRGDNSWVTPTDTNTQLAFANDANNRVVTGDGSGGLNGEANLTFDGSALGVTGKVLIGTATEGHEDSDDLTITNGADDGNRAGITIRSDEYGNIFFSDSTSGAGEYRGILQFDHTNDRFKFQTEGALRASLDSNGLKFGTDTAAANSLDDYEEGTWSPAMSANASSADGKYTKIGQMVHALFMMSVGSNSSSSNMVITGLPFTPAAHNGNISGNVSVSNLGSAFYIFTDSSANIYARNMSNGTMPMSDFSQKYIYGEVHYMTAA